MQASVISSTNTGIKILTSSLRTLEVKARTLRIALGHQSRLVPVQGAVSVVLDLHEPSGANCTLPRGQLDDLPSAIQFVSLHLFLTRLVPQIRVRELLGLPIGRGLSCRRHTSLDDVKRIIRVIIFV